MGGTTFETFVPAGDRASTAEEAFRVARDDAAHESGHGGYTGTIAEKPGFRMARCSPVSRLEADPIMDATMESEFNDKWGDAGCLAIADTPVKTRKVAKVLKLDHENRVGDEDLRAALGLAAGEALSDLKVVADDRKYRTRARRGTGKAERVFVVTGQRGQVTEFPTLLEAVAAVEASRNELADRAVASAVAHPEWSITSAAGATVTTELLSRRVKIEATVSAPAGPAGKVVGWLFYGWASC